MSDDLVKQKKVTEGESCPEASSLIKWVVETELAKHIEELEAKLAKAVEALKHAKLNMPHPDQLIDDTLAELTGGKDA